ncbi:MAG: hypothetical protein ACYTGZ_11560 [Planctomycetota bacterium]|jgi:hypothetical protein
MGRQALIAIVWIATLGIAAFVGMELGEAQAPAGRSAASPRDSGEGARYDASREGPSRDGAEEPDAKAGPSGSAKPGPARSAPAPDADEVDQPFTLEGVETVEEISDRLMRYAKRKLHQGPEGQKALWKTINELTENKEIRRLARDERALMPLLYPWIRFGFENEKQIVDMMETLYKTAHEDPSYFEGMDDDPFEMFTEGLAVMLPGMIDAERLAEFRAHVEKIMKMDKERLPKALKSNLNEFGRNLETWAGPLSSEEMIAQLEDPNVADEVKIELLKRIPRSELRGVDVARIVAGPLARGDRRAIRALGGIPLSGSDLVVLDRAFMEGAVRSNANWWEIRQYADATGRNKWDAVRPLIEEGLRRGGKTTVNFATALTGLNERPPAEYVRQVISSYDLPESLIGNLKRAYKLD